MLQAGFIVRYRMLQAGFIVRFMGFFYVAGCYRMLQAVTGWCIGVIQASFMVRYRMSEY